MLIARGIRIAVAALIISGCYTYSFAAGSGSSADIQKVYNITERDIQDFLIKTKKENPELYANCINMQKNNPAMFNSIVSTGVTQLRLASLSLKLKGISDPAEIAAIRIKTIYNIGDAEMQEFLSKKKTSDPKYYAALMELKNTKFSAYELNLVREISLSKLKGSGVAALNTKTNDKLKSTMILNTEIDLELARFNKLSAYGKKSYSASKLKELLAKRYDLNLSILDDQANIINEQLRIFEKKKQDMARDRDKNIDKELRGSLGYPSGQ